MPSKLPLPRCEGPKLAPFQFQDEKHPEIKFLESIGKGLHGHVLRATIDGKTYAIKLFRFFLPGELFIYYDGEEYTAKDVLDHMDPFHSECRAYGRLKETGNENLAAHCFGYIILNDEQEAELAERGIHDWNRDPKDKRRRPIRGIVKELIESKDAFTFEMIGQMRKDIKSINKLGILVYDLRKDNYLSGRIIDLSQACTVPHIQLDWEKWNASTVKDICARDYERMDSMVARWNEDHPERVYWRCFLASWNYKQKLRNKPGNISSYRMEGANVDVANYDWKNQHQIRKKSRRQTKEPIGSTKNSVKTSKQSSRTRGVKRVTKRKRR